ncbi:biliverdin reductase A [Protopterus annectens]|uniref:biliverdin reductase A n=1 Tax=Protopterus annectens TaxID=7888 RepID=UPI001CFC1891|nr:biliverdin reductase A [Protopterus annectens]
MIGVIVSGIGIAGSVRIRDLLSPQHASPSEKLNLVGFVSRRDLKEVQQVKQMTLEDALKGEEVHTAIICTENVAHEESVRKFLEAGKHVCVEYPMTLSAASAHELYNIADQKGIVLHIEHIELLTEDYKQLKQDVHGKKLIEGLLHFTGGPLDKHKFGFLSFNGIARLTWLVDLFGELSFTSASFEENTDDSYSRLTAHFTTNDNRPLTWIEERAPGLKRAKQINFQFESCTIDHLPRVPGAPVGLFMQDLNLFAEKLLGWVSTKQLAAEKRRILHCLSLADQIREFCKQ